MKKDAALERYFEEAASWDKDHAAMTERSARIAWRIAIGACLLTAIAITALMMLMPLKRVEPFLVRVDNSTGIVDVVPAFAGRADMPETVTRYLLDHYVTVCERFNFSTAESDYEECASFNAAARNGAWYALWDRGNPLSPLNVYKDGSNIRAQVSAITFFKRGNGGEDLSQIRFTKTRRVGGTGSDQVSHWIATVQYVYVEPSKDPRARRWNPLGFKIVDYRAEAEVLPAPEPASGSAQPPVTSSGASP
ncbi:MAG TPA: type IV secretion system protein [Steroidobacteraceae bacterium]